MRFARRPSHLSALVLGGFFLVPASARASGFDTALFGNDDGHPAIGNAYAVYYNPAAMVEVRGTEMTGAATVALHSESYNRPASALTPGDPTSAKLTSDLGYIQSNTGPASLFNTLAAPFLGMVTDFGGSAVRLGLAGYAPFGGTVAWDKNDAFGNGSPVPGGYDGPQRWSNISTVTTTLAGTLALAYYVKSAHLGIGASVSVLRTGVQDTRARNPQDGSDDVFAPNGTIKEGRSYLDVWGVQGGASFGAFWEPVHGVRIGASYVSQPGFGTMRLKGTFQQQFGGEATVSQPAPAELLQAYPDMVRLGAAWRVSPEVDLRLDGTYERWSQFQNQCVVVPGAQCSVSATGKDLTPNGAILANVPRNGQDTYKVRAGVAYEIAEGTQVHGSFAVETSSLPSGYEDALLFDSTRLFFTLGVHQHVAGGLSLALAYTYVQYLSMTVTDSQLPTYEPPSRSPSTDGDYSASLHIFDVEAKYRF
jgi:long-chain fatty acid transport protein